MKTTNNAGSPGLVSLTAALLCCTAFNLHAQTASEDYSIVNNWLSQGNASVNGSQALQNNSCVPTSTANGLAYLDAYLLSIGAPSPFPTSPDTYTAVNALQSQMGTTTAGTTPGQQLAGLQAYLSAPPGANKNPSPSISLGQTFYPSAQNLADVLNAHDGVQVGILWGTISGGVFTPANGGGGHFVSLTSLNLTSGSGTMNILDPWGAGVGNNAGTGSAIMETLSVQTVNLTGQGNVLDVTYSLTVSGPDDTGADNGTTAYGGSGMTGFIAVDTIEAAPEPATCALLGLGAIGLGVRRFFVRRAK